MVLPEPHVTKPKKFQLHYMLVPLADFHPNMTKFWNVGGELLFIPLPKYDTL